MPQRNADAAEPTICTDPTRASWLEPERAQLSHVAPGRSHSTRVFQSAREHMWARGGQLGFCVCNSALLPQCAGKMRPRCLDALSSQLILRVRASPCCNRYRVQLLRGTGRARASRQNPGRCPCAVAGSSFTCRHPCWSRASMSVPNENAAGAPEAWQIREGRCLCCRGRMVTLEYPSGAANRAEWPLTLPDNYPRTPSSTLDWSRSRGTPVRSQAASRCPLYDSEGTPIMPRFFCLEPLSPSRMVTS
jgi:hypothetical protein